MFRHLFDRPESQKITARSRRRAKRNQRLGLESLENRVLLASDLFAQATNLGTVSSASVSGSNIGFSDEAGEPSQSAPTTSAWWKWTAPSNGEVSIDTFGSNFDTFLLLATGSSVDALSVVDRNDDAGGTLQSQIVEEVTGGTTYAIAVDGFLSNEGAINLNLNFVPSGGSSINDLFSNRTILGSAAIVNTSGTNVNFTGESGEPPQSGQINSAWWTWTAPGSGPVTIDTFGSNFDTVLTVATGTSVSNLTVVADNDDAKGGGLQSQVEFDAVAGTDYQIAVDGFQSNTGNIVLNINFDGQTTPGDGSNDSFSGRVDLGSEIVVSTSGTNVNFTVEPGEPEQSGQDINSAWWTWTAPSNGILTVDTFGSGFDTFLTLATGSSVSNLNVLAQNDDTGSGVQSQIVFEVVGGTQYQIAVDGFQSITGPITLNLTFDPGSGGGANDNDMFADRFNLGSDISISTSGPNVGFTGEPGEPAQSGDISSAWWEWIAPANGTVTIDTFGSDFDTFLTVATGNVVNNLTVLAQNDDAGGLFQSEVGLNVIEGTSYHIAVDGFLGGPGNQGNIDLNIQFEVGGAVPEDNDLFADRISLGSSTVANAMGSNVGFTSEFGEPLQSGIVNSAWWTWTAPQSGPVVIDTSGSSFATFVTVATGNSVNALSVVEQSALSQFIVDVVQGNQYHIAIDGVNSATGFISLGLGFGSIQPGNENDQFADRFNLGSDTSVSITGATNVDFTSEPGEPVQSGEINSAWWQWTAPANGTVTVDTIGSNFDTFLTMATGGSVNSLNVLRQNDDSSGLQSSITQDVTQGTVYQFAVDGFGSNTGTISLNLEFDGGSGGPGPGPGPGPGGNNDLFADRIALGSVADVSVTGSNSGFSAEPGEPTQSGIIHSAWWQWTAPSNGTVTIDTAGSNFDTFLTVATGNSLGSLTVLGRNDDFGGTPQSRLVLGVSAGTQYQIAVDGFGNVAQGAIDLNIDFNT